MDDFSFPLLESNVFGDLMEIAPNVALGIWYMSRNLPQPLLPSTSPNAPQSTALSWLYLISAAAIRDTLVIELSLGIQNSLLSFHPLPWSPISPTLSLWVVRLITLPDCQKWVQSFSIWATRDGPPDESPGQEVAEIVSKGVLLVGYMLQSSVLHVILATLFSNWTPRTRCSTVAIFLGTTMIFMRHQADLRTARVRYKHDHIFEVKIHFLFKSAIWLLLVGLKVLAIANGIATLLRRVYWRFFTRVSPEPEKSPYAYEPLVSAEKNIRLLQLSTKFLSRENCCDLVEFSLPNCPAYEAISYTWGSPTKNHRIYVGNRLLRVTANAYSIVEGRRSWWRTKWVWIDSICIDQDNVAEKSLQVAMMGDIYQTAARVIVWLGNGESSLVSKYMLLLERVLFVAQKGFQETVDSRQTLLIGSRTLWHALHECLGHPYWTRVWIVQEIAKAKTVHIVHKGQYIARGYFIGRINPLLHSLTNESYVMRECSCFLSTSDAMWIGAQNAARIDILRNAEMSGQLLDLSHTLTFTDDCRATDSRDHIFALQSMVSKEAAVHIKPDYRMSTADVYTRTSCQLLAENPLFALQRASGYDQKNTSSLASWVADFSQPFCRTSEQHQVVEFQFPGYRASNSHAFDYRISQQSKGGIPELEISGVYVDSVEYLTAPLVACSILEESSRRINAWLQNCFDLLEKRVLGFYSPTSQSIFEAFWRTLVGDRAPRARPAPAEYSKGFHVFKTFADRMSEVDSKSDTSDDFVGLYEWACWGEKFQKAFTYAASNRRFAITKNGYFALVPENATVGASICIIHGLEVPMLLRKVKSNGISDDERFELSGDCYVHGLMDGEGLEMGDPQRFILQ